MSLTYEKDGFRLTITAGVADEAKGKRRWTRVEASFMSHPCSSLEALASFKACLDSFRRGQIVKGEPQLLLGTAEGGVLFALRQKDKVQYLHVQNVADDRLVKEAYLAHLDVARLEIAVAKALQALAPVTVWGPEP